jgi:hypothetical protein
MRGRQVQARLRAPSADRTVRQHNTGELLAILARPGNAGSNTAADHIAIIAAAIAGIPARCRRKLLIPSMGRAALAAQRAALNLQKIATKHGLDCPHDERFGPRLALGAPWC